AHLKDVDRLSVGRDPVSDDQRRDKQDALPGGPRFAFGGWRAAQAVIDLMARRGNGFTARRVGAGPDGRQLIQRGSLPPDVEHPCFSRWARTSAVEYDSSSRSRRSSSSSPPSG